MVKHFKKKYIRVGSFQDLTNIQIIEKEVYNELIISKKNLKNYLYLLFLPFLISLTYYKFNFMILVSYWG